MVYVLSVNTHLYLSNTVWANPAAVDRSFFFPLSPGQPTKGVQRYSRPSGPSYHRMFPFDQKWFGFSRQCILLRIFLPLPVWRRKTVMLLLSTSKLDPVCMCSCSVCGNIHHFSRIISSRLDFCF